MQTLGQGDLAGDSTAPGKSKQSFCCADGWPRCSHLGHTRVSLGKIFKMPLPGTPEVLIQLVWARELSKAPKQSQCVARVDILPRRRGGRGLQWIVASPSAPLGRSRPGGEGRRLLAALPSLASATCHQLPGYDQTVLGFLQ